MDLSSGKHSKLFGKKLGKKSFLKKSLAKKLKVCDAGTVVVI